VDPHHGKANSKMKWHNGNFLNKISCPCRGYKRIIMVVSFVGREGLSTLEIDDDIL
jgi:hypothetical protein